MSYWSLSVEAHRQVKSAAWLQGYPILHNVPNHVAMSESNFLSQITETRGPRKVRLFSKAVNVESCLELADLDSCF